MRKSIRRLVIQSGVWLLAVGFVFGVYSVYRWAEPSPASLAAVTSSAPVNPVNLELDEASFENFAGGSKNWSLQAEKIVLERPPAGSATNSLQSAEIVNIRKGFLFDGSGRQAALPHTVAGQAVTIQPQFLTQESADASAGPPAATFSAGHGYYSINNTEGIPSDMLTSYTVQWQFRLQGDVKLRTREGYQLSAPAITIVELFHRRTGHIERQMLCDQGAQVVAKGARLLANRARFSDSTQTVECLGGVHGSLQHDTLQSEHIYWSLKDNALRCPDAVDGIWQGTIYTAHDVLIDISKGIYTGKDLKMQLSNSAAAKLAIGSLGLMLATDVVSKGQTPAPNTAKSPTTVPSATSSDLATFELKNGYKSVSNTGITTGHFFIYTRGNRVITGDNGRWDKSNHNSILDAEGHLVMDDPEHHVTGQKAHVDEQKGLAILTGEVVLTLKPAPNTPTGTDEKSAGIEEAKNQGAVVTCDQVESFYRKKFTKLSGHLIFKQHILRPGREPLDRTVTAEHAEYDSKKEVLVLFPPSRERIATTVNLTQQPIRSRLLLNMARGVFLE